MLVAGEDRRQRAGIQPGLERVRRVGARADLAKPDSRSPASMIAPRTSSTLVPRPEQLEPGHARHPVVQSAHLPPAIVSSPMLKNLISGSGAPFAFVEHVDRGRALDLEAVELPPPVGLTAVRSSRSTLTS